MHICLYTLNSMTVIYIERNHEGVWRPWLFARRLGEIIPVLDFPQDAEDFKIGIIWGTVFLELINCIFLAPLNVLLPVRVLVLHWEPKLSSEFSFEFMFFNVFNGLGSRHNELLPLFLLLLNVREDFQIIEIYFTKWALVFLTKLSDFLVQL